MYTLPCQPHDTHNTPHTHQRTSSIALSLLGGVLRPQTSINVRCIWDESVLVMMGAGVLCDFRVGLDWEDVGAAGGGGAMGAPPRGPTQGAAGRKGGMLGRVVCCSGGCWVPVCEQMGVEGRCGGNEQAMVPNVYRVSMIGLEQMLVAFCGLDTMIPADPAAPNP